MPSMQFITYLFHGECVSVLVGHPEFEVLFTVEHIARLGFVENPSSARALVMEEVEGYGFMQLNEIVAPIAGSVISDPPKLKGYGGVWLASAAETYRVLLRAGSPSASFFRNLVTRNIIPDVRDISQTNRSHAVSASVDSERARMEFTIKILERELAAERRHAEQLKKSLRQEHEFLRMAFEEVELLRRGVPYFERRPDPEGPLERMQWEQDQQALPWLRPLMETEVSLCRVDTEEKWWRSPEARERREAFARVLRRQ